MQNKNSSFFSSSPAPTLEELKKYLDGQLSLEERNALEKRLESADLYSEGMEGIEMLEAGDTLDKITYELNARIDQKIAQEKKFSYVPYLSLAAMLLLICGIIFTFLRYQTNQFEVADQSKTVSLKQDQELLPLPLAEEKPQPSPQVLKNTVPPAPDIALSEPIIQADKNPLSEDVNNVVPSIAYNESKISEEIQSAPTLAKESSKDYSESDIYNDMLGFVDLQIHLMNDPAKLKEVVAIGYGTTPRSSNTEKKDELKSSNSALASPKKSVRMKGKIPKNYESKREDASINQVISDTFSLQKKYFEVLNEIYEGDVDSAEQRLTQIPNKEAKPDELGHWLKAVIYLKKNRKTEAINTLKTLAKSNSEIGIEARRILILLEK